MSKVLLLGLDGATFDYMDPWLEAGKLPNLARLIDRGSRGVLRSTYLPTTATAWPTMITGKNAGKHGLFEFRYQARDSYELLPSQQLGIGGDPLHLYLSRRGLRVGMVNVPMTYPPRDVNGVMISGFTTPREATDWCHPPRLADELAAAGKPYPMGQLHDLMRMEKQRRVREKIDSFISGWEAFVTAQTDVIIHLWQQDAYDFFMLVFSNTDHINHHTPDLNHIYQIYKQVDDAIGRILAVVDEETTVLVTSDHGSAPLRKYIVLNSLLSDLGLIRFKPEIAPRFIRHLARRVAWRYRRQATGIWTALPRIVRRLISRPLLWKDPRLKCDYENIDWDHTQAYAFSGIGTLYVNLKGREPNGIVEPGTEYEAVRTRLIKALLNLRDPESGQSLVEKAQRGEEIFSGPYMAYAPDVVFLRNVETVRAITGFASDRVIRSSIRADGTSPEYGYHTRNGILVAAGPGIRAGAQLEESNIHDIAPTILHLIGLPIPSSMDGEVIEELFVQPVPVTYTDEADESEEEHLTNVSHTISQTAREEIEERLRALGYLD